MDDSYTGRSNGGGDWLYFSATVCLFIYTSFDLMCAIRQDRSRL